MHSLPAPWRGGRPAAALARRRTIRRSRERHRIVACVLQACRGVILVVAGGVVAGIVAGFPARAEFPEPRLTAILPPGGRQGTSLEVTVVGSDLDELQRLEFFHPGITSEPVLAAPTEFDPEPRPVPGKVKVTIGADVPPGIYDAAAVGRFGVSNPRAFMVGAAAEAVAPGGLEAADKALESPADGVVSGRVAPNAAAHVAVQLEAGSRLRADLWARRIDSRLDGVLELLDPSGRVVARSRRPRGEDPLLDVTAATSGRHVIRIHDRFVRGGDEFFYRLLLSTGPVVEAVFPPAVEAGSGTVQLTAIGRGLPDASPSAVEDDPPGLVERSVDVQPGSPEDAAAARLAWRMLAPRDTAVPLVGLHGDLLASAAVPFAALASPGPVTLEREPNDDPTTATPLTLPAVVAGRANPRGDRDWLTFEAKAGDTWVFDLHSRRLGMPTDMALVIQRVLPAPEGQPAPDPQDVASADDGAAEFPAIYGLAASDPTLTFKAPADGTYRVLVKELAVDAVTGVDRAWVLEVRRPDPGFDLLAVLGEPDRAVANKTIRDVPVVAGGGGATVEVLVIRRDGFAGEVTLEAEGLPQGVAAPAVVVPANANRGTVVVTAAADAPPVTTSFRIVGRAAVAPDAGAPLERVARTATLQWDVPNQNQPHIYRESRALPLAVAAVTAPLTVAPKESKAWETTPGGKVTVPLAVTRREGAKGDLSLAAANLPKELKVAAVKIDAKATEAAVTIDVDGKLPAGTYSVVLKGVAKMAFARNPQAAQRLRADADRLAALAKQRAAEATSAREALAAAEKRFADAQATGQPPDPALESARVEARKSLEQAEARAKSAEEERGRREKVATDAAAANAPKDIDVPIILAPITVVVAEPPKPEPAKQEPPKS